MESSPPNTERTAGSPMKWGILFFLVSEVFLFGSLFWTYYYLRGQTPGWPPEHPDAILASINTFFLLSSSVTMWWAIRSIRLGRESGLALGLGATLVLGATFLGITIFEWIHEPFQPWTNAYGSIFFTLTGFHALHVLAGLLLISALLTRTLRHRFSSTRFLGAEIGSYYWHFVDLIWIFVFSSIFIIR
jgi:heme/copper-type cytochrome/quinol oxidase subunit 3